MDIWAWVTPIVGVGLLVVIPLVIAWMCTTVVNRLTAADFEAHEVRLDKPVLLRKDEARQRHATEKTWDRIEGYRKARNICLLVSFTVLEINALSALILLVNLGSIFSFSLLAVALIAFAYCVHLVRKKRPRPEWVTTPDYYRDLATGD